MKITLSEAPLNQRRNKVGETKFTATTISDSHIQKIIDHIVAETGVKKEDIENNIKKQVDKFSAMKIKAPTLYHTIFLNIVEGEVFKALKDVPVKTAPKFNTITFMNLVSAIKGEHRSLFPMRDLSSHKSLHNPSFIFVPGINKEQAEFNSVPTAAATPKGQFIFNKDFMQELLNFAHLKGLKPKDKKYSNNGGKIPPEWAYIEFLIMHEFMHYTYSDFHYSKIYKADAKISNWVGDFRSNYDLVKNNHEQLPIGLYNDLINLDQQKNWKEMYDIVKAEFEKLSKDQQDDITSHLGDIEGGEHIETDEKPEGEPEGESKKDVPTEEEAEEHANQVREKAAKQEDDKPKEDKPKSGGSGKGPGGRGGRGSGGGDTNSAIDYSKYKPTMSWRSLLSKLVRVDSEEESTYQRIHRRSTSRIHTAIQTGNAAIKPGDILNDTGLLKLVIVVDSSGSMSDQIEQIYANIASLIKNHPSDLGMGFVLVKFSNSYKTFFCDVKAQRFTEITAEKNMSKKAVLEKGNLKTLFSQHYGSSTNFDSALTTELDGFLKKDYDVLVITDTDIASGDNLKEFNKFFKSSGGRVYLILKSKEDYQSVITSMKMVPANITHM